MARSGVPCSEERGGVHRSTASQGWSRKRQAGICTQGAAWFRIVGLRGSLGSLTQEVTAWGHIVVGMCLGC
jgi:hypothetical protein